CRRRLRHERLARSEREHTCCRGHEPARQPIRGWVRLHRDTCGDREDGWVAPTYGSASPRSTPVGSAGSYYCNPLVSRFRHPERPFLVIPRAARVLHFGGRVWSGRFGVGCSESATPSSERHTVNSELSP